MGIFMKILSDRRMQGVSCRIFWLFQGEFALLPACVYLPAGKKKLKLCH